MTFLRGLVVGVSVDEVFLEGDWLLEYDNLNELRLCKDGMFQ